MYPQRPASGLLLLPRSMGYVPIRSITLPGAVASNSPR